MLTGVINSIAISDKQTEELEILLKFPSNGSSNDLNISLIKGQGVVIVGPNGCGKSSFGHQLSVLNIGVLRVCAERHNSFPELIAPSSFDESLARFNNFNRSMGRPNYPQSDFENILRALFAEEYKIAHVAYYDTAEILSKRRVESKFQVLKGIIQKILFPLQLKMEDYKLYGSKDGENWYKGTDLSDGEKHTIYLIGKCLLDNNPFIIIDEPEIHLHKAVISDLWTEIENAKPDTTFIYITHDLDFAASRMNSEKIWVKNYNPTSQIWDWVNISNSIDIPEEVFLKVIGSRKPVIFVEGDSDIWVYKTLYPKYLVISCDGCEQVIQFTKAFQRLNSFHHIEPVGIIDRDFRTEHELEVLKSKKIFSLEVAELENLFCTEAMLKAFSEYECSDKLEAAKEIVLKQFEDLKLSQIVERTQAEIRFLLEQFETKVNNAKSLRQAYNEHVANINIEELYEANEKLYESIKNSHDLILKYLNFKPLVDMMNSPFGFKPMQYKEKIFNRVMKNEDFKVAFTEALAPFVPNLN